MKYELSEFEVYQAGQKSFEITTRRRQKTGSEKFEDVETDPVFIERKKECGTLTLC